MNDQKKLLSLLPKGFEDLLPPDAETEFRGIGILMKCFARFGYERVKPPLVEFEDSLFAPGPGAALADQTFRMMDPQSEKMLALRSDITPQIARIATSRMDNAALPLRLAYANDAVRTRASQQRTFRQFAQVGCELVGAPEGDDVIEMAVVALKGLAELKIQNVTIDFSLPDIFEALIKATDIAEGDLDGLRAQIAGEASSAIAKIEDLGLEPVAAEQVVKLKSVIERVREAVEALGVKHVSYSVDPIETKGFEYHSGVVFTLFSKDAHGELGRGGRYAIDCDDQSCQGFAAGFTLYMDTVRMAMPALSRKKRVFVSFDTNWGVLEELHDEGFVTVRGKAYGDEALLGTCTHIYKDGKVVEV
ncbi:MAG: ATP phosphoribosyltransferase regulatory subunit [Bdellovibrionales bacterium]